MKQVWVHLFKCFLRSENAFHFYNILIITGDAEVTAMRWPRPAGIATQTIYDTKPVFKKQITRQSASKKKKKKASANRELVKVGEER